MLKQLLAALICVTSLPAAACSVHTPEFDDLLEQPMHAIVIGHYVPEPNDLSGRSYSNLFVVTEVLQGELELKQYRLMMTGPWGSTCGISTVESKGSPEAKNNPVVLLVERKIDETTLDLPFMGPDAGIIDGNLMSVRHYVKKSKKPYDWKYLDKPQEIQMNLTAFRQWLQSSRNQSAPWQVSSKK